MHSKTLRLAVSWKYYYLYQDKHTPGSQMVFWVQFIGQQNRTQNAPKMGRKSGKKHPKNNRQKSASLTE